MKRYSIRIWRIRIFLASLLLGEPLYKDTNQEIRHNVISSALKIKWLAKKNEIDKEDYEAVCESCNIICGEIDKVK